MSTKTFNGDVNLLFIIKEQFVDFDESKDKYFDPVKTISKQKFKDYFNMSHGLIYTNLVT